MEPRRGGGETTSVVNTAPALPGAAYAAIRVNVATLATSPIPISHPLLLWTTLPGLGDVKFHLVGVLAYEWTYGG